MRNVVQSLAILVVVCSRGIAGAADPLPEDAARLVASFEEDASAIRAEAEARIARHRKELAAELKKLQDEYCKAAKLDEAVAIRDTIRQLTDATLAAQPDPGSMVNLGGEVGRRFLFRVTGSVNGFVYGTDVYTADSAIATAAVHAGILRNGQTGVVQVTVVPGRNSYAASTRNGVTSNAWGAYLTSYSISRASVEPAMPAGPAGGAPVPDAILLPEKNVPR